MKKINITIFLLSVVPSMVYAVEYNCLVTKKFNSNHEYTENEISNSQFSVLIEENKTTSYLSRCSFVKSVEKVTCDRYEVDKISLDNYVNIKKYYVFSSHFDMQIFSNLTFIENNGRGDIAYGKCRITSP